MKSNKSVSIVRAAIFGAAFGLVWVILRPFLVGTEPIETETARLVGLYVGSALGGAFLFALVAAAMNYVRR